MRAILMHGKDTDPTQKWYPWFRKVVEDAGLEFNAPTLPNANDPKIEEWVQELQKLNPDEETILVGHSRGGVAILRWLEQKESKPVRKVILAATNSGFLKNKAVPEENGNGFYTASGYDFDAIREKCNEFVVLHSRDDAWVPFSHGEENAAGLRAKFLMFDDRGHFGRDVGEIPELLEEVRQAQA